MKIEIQPDIFSWCHRKRQERFRFRTISVIKNHFNFLYGAILYGSKKDFNFFENSKSMKYRFYLSKMTRSSKLFSSFDRSWNHLSKTRRFRVATTNKRVSSWPHHFLESWIRYHNWSNFTSCYWKLRFNWDLILL